EVGSRIEEALGRAFAPDDVETLGDLIEAAGVLRVANATSRIEAYCGHANPTLRDHAAHALTLLKSAKTACVAAATPPEPAKELGHLATSEVKLELETDAGTLSIALDPSVAPVAVT